MPDLVNAVHLRTLQRALETLGSKERLAAALGIAVADFDAYMAAKEIVPIPVFIAALDIVALRSGHLASRNADALTLRHGGATLLHRGWRSNGPAPARATLAAPRARLFSVAA